MCGTDYWHWRYQTFFLTEAEQELNFSLASQELMEKYQDLERKEQVYIDIYIGTHTNLDPITQTV